MKDPEALIRSLASATLDSGFDLLIYREARLLRNFTESDIADALSNLAPDDRRPHTLFIHIARRLCGNQEDGNLPPFHALDNEPDVSCTTRDPSPKCRRWPRQQRRRA